MRTWLLIIAVFAASPVAAEMWKCIDSDGNSRYTNVRADAKGCTSLNLDPINTAPAFKAPQSKPANFPSVDNDTQKQRDASRRRILEQELAQEQLQLETAKKQLGEQREIRLGSEKNAERMEERIKPFADRVKLHESNIENIRKEISGIR
jgi:Domain of unknown function (DUF4124)